MNDDKKLKHIESEYGSGRMLTGEAKAELVKVSICSPESATYSLCASQLLTEVQPLPSTIIHIAAMPEDY